MKKVLFSVTVVVALFIVGGYGYYFNKKKNTDQNTRTGTSSTQTTLLKENINEFHRQIEESLEVSWLLNGETKKIEQVINQPVHEKDRESFFTLVLHFLQKSDDPKLERKIESISKKTWEILIRDGYSFVNKNKNNPKEISKSTILATRMLAEIPENKFDEKLKKLMFIINDKKTDKNIFWILLSRLMQEPEVDPQVISKVKFFFKSKNSQEVVSLAQTLSMMKDQTEKNKLLSIVKKEIYTFQPNVLPYMIAQLCNYQIPSKDAVHIVKNLMKRRNESLDEALIAFVVSQKIPIKDLTSELKTIVNKNKDPRIVNSAKELLNKSP